MLYQGAGIPVDVIGIKENNKRIIADLLRFADVGMTKKEVSDSTRLSFATVSNLCNEMLEAGLLQADKKSEIAVGRSPYALCLNYNKYRTVCINVQMQAVLGIGLLNLRNEVICYKKYDVKDLSSPEAVIHEAKLRFDSDFGEFCAGYKLIGVGVAVSGIFDISSEKLVNCAVRMYEGSPIKLIVEREFSLPSYVDNESNLCAIGMRRRISNCLDLIYIHISEGLGVGIICQGMLLRGAHGYGGEVAFIPIGDKDKYCPISDSYGCIENDISIPAIISDFMDNKPSLCDKLKAWGDFVAALEAGNQKAVKIGENVGRLIGELCAILINIFDTEKVVIGGEISQLDHFINEYILSVINKKCHLYGKRDISIDYDAQSEKTINEGLSEMLYERLCISSF